MTPQIITGIASFGMSGRIFHGPLLAHNPLFLIKRIVERSTSDAHTLHPGIIPSKSFDDILGDEEIMLIIVNTPDDTHFEFAQKGLEAGKHVVVEKPFTQTVAQAEELIRIAAMAGRVLSVFQNRRWAGDFLTVQRIIRENMLGRLVEYEARWDRYLNSLRPNTWKEQADRGAGMLPGLGTHLIDQAVVLFGMPEAVTAHLKSMRTGGEIIDWFEVRLHYPDKNVTVRGSYLAREPAPRYVLHGTLGSFVKHGMDPQEAALKEGKNPTDPEWGKEPGPLWGLLNTEKDGLPVRAVMETLSGNYNAYYDNIAECILHDGELAVKPEEALNVMKIIEAAKRSNEKGKRVGV
ncbi:MAG: Gfo/Idh/MocA family oxidoreductase [Bacteroidota bacterium]